MSGQHIGTADAFHAATEATHAANAAAEAEHLEHAGGAIAALPAHRVVAAPASPGGDQHGDGPGR